MKYMDTVTFKHWAFFTQKNPLQEYVWVVLKHEVDYLKQTVLGDRIMVKTQIREIKEFKYERLIVFYKHNQLLVKAKTIQGMLDAKIYKPSIIRENTRTY